MLHLLLADGSAPTLTWTTVVNLLVGVVAPILVALVNRGRDLKLKAVELAVISGATGILNDWLVSNGAFHWGQALINAVITFIVAVATIFGLYEPTGISDKARSSGRT